MDLVYIFYENKNIFGVFSDFRDLKEQVLNHVLRKLVDNKTYITKREIGEKFKKNLISLFKEDIYSTEIENYIWEIKKFPLDKIYTEDSKIKKEYDTTFTKIRVKGKKCSTNDLKKTLVFLKLTPLYTS